MQGYEIRIGETQTSPNAVLPRNAICGHNDAVAHFRIAANSERYISQRRIVFFFNGTVEAIHIAV